MKCEHCRHAVFTFHQIATIPPHPSSEGVGCGVWGVVYPKAELKLQRGSYNSPKPPAKVK